ncbi:MAG: helix-turn-helix transcriptional regulator [Oscillospiraceae bacterium]|nr:helix-turn-helix transcriptional regulator [Oscillospiraceae bacterium]
MKELTWEEVKKSFNLTKEEELEIQLEMELIEATIAARKKANLSQRELGKRCNIKQPAIARIEKRSRSPQASTLIKMLYPLGYTLRVVPIKEEKKEKSTM